MFLTEKGIWLSLQPFTLDKDAFRYANPASAAKYAQMVAGTDQVCKWAKQHRVKVVPMPCSMRTSRRDRALSSPSSFDGTRRPKR